MSTVNERFQEANTSDTKDGKKTVRTFMVTLLADGSEDAFTDLQILSQSGVPQLYDALPGSANMECTDRRCSLEREDKRHRIVTCTYGMTPYGVTSEMEKNPWSRPAVINFKGLSVPWYDGRAYRTLDTQGNPTKPICNSAGTLYDNPPPRMMNKLVISISRAVKDDDFDLSEITYRDTLNKNAITIAGVSIAEKEALMRDIRADAKMWLKVTPVGGGTPIEEQIVYWQVTYEIEVCVDCTHEVRLLNKGPFYLIGGNTAVPLVKKAFVNDDTQREYDGKLKADGDALVDPDLPATVPTWSTFQMNFAMDGAPLDRPANRLGN